MKYFQLYFYFLLYSIPIIIGKPHFSMSVRLPLSFQPHQWILIWYFFFFTASVDYIPEVKLDGVYTLRYSVVGIEVYGKYISVAGFYRQNDKTIKLSCFPRWIIYISMIYIYSYWYTHKCKDEDELRKMRVMYRDINVRIHMYLRIISKATDIYLYTYIHIRIWIGRW